MKLIKTAIVTSILVLSGTSAFAGTATNASATHSNSTHNVVTRQVHVVKAPVLLESSTYTPRKVKRIVIQPVETLVVRDASTSDHSPFIYQLGKHANTKAKTYRPSTSQTKAMPNLFKK